MASAIENGCGVIVVFGGAIGVILWIGTAIFVDDAVIHRRTVTIPAVSAEVQVGGVPYENSTVTFELPARNTTQELQMAIVSPKWGSAGELEDIGFRHADLRECREYVQAVPLRATEGGVEYLCCLGSRGERPFDTYGAVLSHGGRTTNSYTVNALNLDDHNGGVETTCQGRYVGVKR
jgi:hypothetical protein